MQRLGMVLVVALVIASCGGESDSADTGDTDAPTTAGSDAPDPCTLADDSIMAAYFGDVAVDGERSESGPIMGCSWADANANSLLIQTASNYDLYRLDPCDECVDITFGDDGYAAPSPIQSTAKVVDGTLWVSVTTTGFGDDAESITDLLETVYQNASG